MVEAWAAGIPLITAAAAGPKAYCRNGENGQLVPTDDVEALANAINRCLTDPELCRRLIEGGRRTYQSTFTSAVLVRDMTAFYTKAIVAYGRGRCGGINPPARTPRS